MSGISIQRIAQEIDTVHRELAKITLGRILGTPSAISAPDVLETHCVPFAAGSIDAVRAAVKDAGSEDERERLQRILFACMDLAVEEKTASLDDMLVFYMRRGFMHVGSEKIPALEVTPWLQEQDDFDRRELMGEEMRVFLKGLVNPMLTAMTEVTAKTVTKRFGFDNYVQFAEAKKGISFSVHVEELEKYLAETEEVYRSRMVPWVEEEIGRPLDGLGRCHAIRLARIRKFDSHFPVAKLGELVERTFCALGFDAAARPDVTLEISDDDAKTPDSICLGVEIPGEIHVVTRPVGGFIDVESLLHETGHAFFLANFDPGLPMEYRRLYRCAALDETFAFLFAGLVENRAWLQTIAGLPQDETDELVELCRTRRLCLIRRYIGKFLAEVEFHEKGDLKYSEPYARRLKQATGFTYEPEGFLFDMERDFYSLDYVRGWAGANVLSGFLEQQFGESWFQQEEAGRLLQEIATEGRRRSLDDVMTDRCGCSPQLPRFQGD